MYSLSSWSRKAYVLRAIAKDDKRGDTKRWGEKAYIIPIRLTSQRLTMGYQAWVNLLTSASQAFRPLPGPGPLLTSMWSAPLIYTDLQYPRDQCQPIRPRRVLWNAAKCVGTQPKLVGWYPKCIAKTTIINMVITWKCLRFAARLYCTFLCKV